MSTALPNYSEASVPDDGGDEDAWGPIVNAVLAIFDRFGAGVKTCDLSSGNVTLTTDESQNGVLLASGTLTATRAIYLPSGKRRRYAVINLTSGDFNVHVRVTGATGRYVRVPRSTTVTLYSNGTHVYALGPAMALTDSVASPNEQTGGFPDYALDLDKQRPGIRFMGDDGCGFARRGVGIIGVGLRASDDADKLRFHADATAANPLIAFAANFNSGLFIKTGASPLSGKGIGFAVSAAERGYVDNGWVFGTPSGADKGLGSLNAQALYVNGNALNPITSSTEISLPTGNSFDLKWTHGLAAKPRFVEAVLICKTAEYGYAVGDEVRIRSMDTGNDSRTAGVWASATEVGLTVRNDISVVRKDQPTQQASITHSRWRVIFHIIQ